MSKSATFYESISSFTLEPYRFIDQIEPTKKDQIILDFFLENGNVPTHEGGITRGVTIESKSGRKLRTITKKHAGDRCRYLEKAGILTHISKKPLRGAGYRTPHYFLNDDIEAFQTLVDIYLKRENPLRMLVFMQSRYLDEAIDKNISKLLVRWLIPDEESEFHDELFLLILHEKLRMMSKESDAEGAVEKNLPGQDIHDGNESVEAVTRLLDALKSIDRNEVEKDILLFFDNKHIFTEKQKNTYTDIARLSPTALHMLVFLPFPKLLDQYAKLGLTDVLVSLHMEPLPKADQEQIWADLNTIIHKILFHSMTVDLMRYPFLIMQRQKRAIFDRISNPSR